MLVQDLLYGRDTFSVELMQMAPYEWGVSVLSYSTVPYHVCVQTPGASIAGSIVRSVALSDLPTDLHHCIALAE